MVGDGMGVGATVHVQYVWKNDYSNRSNRKTTEAPV